MRPINLADCQETKEFVIIGNGPSAITLSYLLAGNWPYYKPSEPHPNIELNARLTSPSDSETFSDQLDLSTIPLVKRDLQYLSNGLPGRSRNPVSILFDALQHPDADIGSDIPTALSWSFHPEKSVSHLVLGSGPPGGSWQKMKDCNNTLTISLGTWMQLPNLNIRQWSCDTKRESRVPLGRVAKYYRDYVKCQDLEKYFLNNSQVTRLEYNEDDALWKVSVMEEKVGHFTISTPRVVLATGVNEKPNKLGIKGESFPFVIKSLTEFEKVLSNLDRTVCNDPVLIVGAGLSAADAVITARFEGIPVYHAFRRHPDDPTLIFNQLPGNMYPEYHKVHQKMKGKSLSTDYKAFPMHCISEIRANRTVVLTNLIGAEYNGLGDSTRTTLQVSYILALIGRRANLDFIYPKRLRSQLLQHPTQPFHSRNNPIAINPFTHECLNVEKLYAMGPLVGDNFVRFVQGGALAIANHFWSSSPAPISPSSSSSEDSPDDP
ncbi:oxidative stress-induced growth inhibitor 1-like [Panonychus citri]|uniref:oxidative stress-induced growth inhibitor 1-like n=1 Tax=Panonychus citri TaxID=50023 RepID=UPI002307538B|nr:oxidative stress-induced growth inhibitor 1-like [Panonychus citri]